MGGAELVSGSTPDMPRAQVLMDHCVEPIVARLDPEPQSHSLAVPSLETAAGTSVIAYHNYNYVFGQPHI